MVGVSTSGRCDNCRKRKIRVIFTLKAQANALTESPVWPADPCLLAMCAGEVAVPRISAYMGFSRRVPAQDTSARSQIDDI